MLSIYNRPTHTVLDTLRHEFDDIFRSVLDAGPNLGRREGQGFSPAVNLWEDGAMLFAQAELPGVPLDTLDIEVLGDTLTIRGRRDDGTPKDASVLRRERPFGPFARQINLPCAIDAAKVEATMHEGVLTVRLPKAPEAQARKITVKSA